ncbi:MAG: TerD family protein, partial [Selenomonadaceae bacterium]|nr:TerD family protein [Selenomonadaceae bacterium]
SAAPQNISQYRQDRQPDFSAAPQNISHYLQDWQPDFSAAPQNISQYQQDWQPDFSAAPKNISQYQQDGQPDFSAASKNISQYQQDNSQNISVLFNAKKIPLGLPVDVYAFCLGANGKVTADGDMIFFNNPRHESLSLSLNSKDAVAGIDLSLKDIPQDIQAVVIYFAIYDTGNRAENNFSKFVAPEIIIRADEKILAQIPLNLGQEKIFQALEIYRSNDTWKFKFTGAGFMNQIEKICNFYGVEIF